MNWAQASWSKRNARRSASVSWMRTTAAVVTNSLRDCPATANPSWIRASCPGVRRIARRASLRWVVSGLAVMAKLYAFCANGAWVGGRRDRPAGVWARPQTGNVKEGEPRLCR